MARYFIEVSYKGSRYSGFQIQKNSNTVQAEVERALNLVHGFSQVQYQKDAVHSDHKLNEVQPPGIHLTGSSRTDAGVHAIQNFFHFDFEEPLHPQLQYKINAMLPADLVVTNILPVHAEAHSRFDALSRKYTYRIHQFKNPFLNDTSYYYPYKLDFDLLTEGAAIIKQHSNFLPFSKTNTQVLNFNCTIYNSEWNKVGDHLLYTIEANRFLRGMVRLVTATLLKVARGKLSLEELIELFETNRKCGYSVPAHGLFLEEIKFPANYFKQNL